MKNVLIILPQAGSSPFLSSIFLYRLGPWDQWGAWNNGVWFVAELFLVFGMQYVFISQGVKFTKLFNFFLKFS
jgi:hypothetical protein